MCVCWANYLGGEGGKANKKEEPSAHGTGNSGVTGKLLAWLYPFDLNCFLVRHRK